MTDLAAKKPDTPLYNEQQPRYEDEIDLLDLWLVLVRRKKVIAVTLATILLIGLLTALTRPDNYGYTTTIEIGNIFIEKGVGIESRLIDEPETVLAKIKESYIPLVLHDYAENHPDDKNRYELKVRIAKNSEILIIEGKGKGEKGPVFLELMQEVTNHLSADHKRLMDVTKGRLNAKLAKENIRLEELQDPHILEVSKQKLQYQLAHHEAKLVEMDDQAELLKSQYKRLDDVDALLKKQITELEQQIATALTLRQDALKKVDNEAMAMTMLMIDNQLQRNRIRLADLEERLHVEQKTLREENNNTLAQNRRQKDLQQQQVSETRAQLTKLQLDNKRAIALHKQIIGESETQLANLKETRAIVPPMQSLEPTGPNKKLIIALSLVLGLMLGLFAAFISEFLAKARTRLQETNT